MREGGNSMVDIKQYKMAGKNPNISVIIIEINSWNGWSTTNVLLKIFFNPDWCFLQEMYQIKMWERLKIKDWNKIFKAIAEKRKHMQSKNQ